KPPRRSSRSDHRASPAPGTVKTARRAERSGASSPRSERSRWSEPQASGSSGAGAEQRVAEPTTPSGIPLRPVYGPDDLPASHGAARASAPGEPPFLRGAYPRMYRAKPWRIFQLSGYGSPEELNRRLHLLLEQGETGFI